MIILLNPPIMNNDPLFDLFDTLCDTLFEQEKLQKLGLEGAFVEGCCDSVFIGFTFRKGDIVVRLPDSLVDYLDAAPPLSNNDAHSLQEKIKTHKGGFSDLFLSDTHE